MAKFKNYVVKQLCLNKSIIVFAKNEEDACKKFYSKIHKPFRKFGIKKHNSKYEFGVYALNKFVPENLIVKLFCKEYIISWKYKEVD